MKYIYYPAFILCIIFALVNAWIPAAIALFIWATALGIEEESNPVVRLTTHYIKPEDKTGYPWSDK